MATKCLFRGINPKISIAQLSLLNFNGRTFHTTPIMAEVRSGRVKITPKRTKPVTYERSLPPHHIAHRKSWNSWNTSTIEGGLRKAETLFDDVFIRKFIVGTFHNMVHSEVIIKRQHNIIRIAMILLPRLSPSKLGFLLGYSEEILSFWFQCPVKIEFQTISSAKDVVFKYV